MELPGVGAAADNQPKIVECLPGPPDYNDIVTIRHATQPRMNFVILGSVKL